MTPGHFKAKVVNVTKSTTVEVGVDYNDGDGYVIPFAGEVATVPAVSFAYGDHICNDFSFTVKEPIAGINSFEFNDLIEIQISTDGTNYTKWFTGQVEEVSKEVNEASGLYEDTFTYGGRGLWKSLEKLIFYLGNDSTSAATYTNTDPSCLYGPDTKDLIDYMFNGTPVPSGQYLTGSFYNPVITDVRPEITYDSSSVLQSSWVAYAFKSEWESAVSILDTLKNINTGYAAGQNISDPARPFIWGVDEDKRFRFFQIDATVGYSWDLGTAPLRLLPTDGDLSKFNRTTNTENITNEILFSGHWCKQAVRSIWSTDSISRYNVQQKRINNRNVVSASDATNWFNGFAYWAAYPLDRFELSLRDKNTPVQIKPTCHANMMLDGTAISDEKDLNQFPIESVRYSITADGIETTVTLGYPQPDFSMYFRELKEITNREPNALERNREEATYNRTACMFFKWNGCMVGSPAFNSGITGSLYDGTDICWRTRPWDPWPDCGYYIPGDLPLECAYSYSDPEAVPSDTNWQCLRPQDIPVSKCKYGRGITGVSPDGNGRKTDLKDCYRPKGFDSKRQCMYWYGNVTYDSGGNLVWDDGACINVNAGGRANCVDGRGWLTHPFHQDCGFYRESTQSIFGPPCIHRNPGANATDPKDDICAISTISGYSICTGGTQHGPWLQNDCNQYTTAGTSLDKPSCLNWMRDSQTDTTGWCLYFSTKDGTTDPNIIRITTKSSPPPYCRKAGKYIKPEGCVGFQKITKEYYVSSTESVKTGVDAQGQPVIESLPIVRRKLAETAVGVLSSFGGHEFKGMVGDFNFLSSLCTWIINNGLADNWFTFGKPGTGDDALLIRYNNTTNRISFGISNGTEDFFTIGEDRNVTILEGIRLRQTNSNFFGRIAYGNFGPEGEQKLYYSLDDGVTWTVFGSGSSGASYYSS